MAWHMSGGCRLLELRPLEDNKVSWSDLLSERHDIHRHRDLVRSATDKDAANGGNVGVIASPGQRDVLFRRQQIVRGIEVDPAELAAVDRNPGVRGIGSHQPRLARGWDRPQVAADIARRQSERAQASDGDVGQILADTAPAVEIPPARVSARRWPPDRT